MTIPARHRRQSSRARFFTRSRLVIACVLLSRCLAILKVALPLLHKVGDEADDGDAGQAADEGAEQHGVGVAAGVLSHRDGYSEETTLSAAYDNSGNKNSIQAVGSAMTYLQRYTLKAALGLAVSHDDDGKAANKAPQAAPLPAELTAVQAKRLRDLIAQSNTDEAKFLGVAKAASIEEIAPADFARLEGLLKRKVSEAAKAAATPEAEPAKA